VSNGKVSRACDDPSKPHIVLFWGSHPDQDNDDCWTGHDFATLAEAQEHLANPWDVKWYTPEYGFGTDQTPEQILAQKIQMYRDSTAFFELDSPELPETIIQANPDYDARQAARRRQSDDAAERSEYAMQQGMGLGVNAYNEARGCAVEEPPDDAYNRHHGHY
jgi:hypothetical protein